LFCGDTLFAGGCGRLFEGSAAQMHASLERLAALPAETLVHCAHEYTLSNLRFARAVEPDNSALAAREVADAARRERNEPTVPSTLALERATNPFLRSAERAVRAAARERAGRELPRDEDVFGVIRSWKDSYR
jgi:hydroxyacylglutathione hydrolase